MARAGLGQNWNCLFANDFDPKKSRTYELNWAAGFLKLPTFAKFARRICRGMLSWRGLLSLAKTCRSLGITLV